MVRLFYTCSLLVLAVLASPFHSVAPAEAAGPSFSCAQPKDALDRLTCSDGALAASEIRMVQAYYALRHTADAERQNQLKTEFLRFVVDIRARCGLPSVQPGRDQSAFVPPAPSAACVRQLYDGQRNKWAGRLSGPAAEEAARPPDGNIGLQARLRDLGLLPKEATVDGVFGTATRSAVTAWQLANGRPGTGFLADADAALLGGAAIASAAPKDRWADVTVAPLATIDYHGPTVEASVGDLKVALAAGNSRDPGLCGGGKGALLPMISTTTTGAAGCKVIGLKLTMGDRVVLEQAVTAFETNADFDRLGVKVTFRRLVPGSEIPQVLLQGYTGGAHCCTHTVALVGGRDGAWKAFGLGGLDGDVGYAYLDPARDGSTLLVSAVGEFNYRFASYAGSYDTDRIQAFTDGKLVDVTRESRFLPFLRSELRRMEASWRANQGGERNGYLAAWVAQKLLVGEFDDAWRTMLGLYDRTSADGLTGCSLDEDALRKIQAQPIAACPNGYAEQRSFPLALATFLNERGYVTQAQATSVGFDLMAIETRRAADTARYVERINRTWFVIDAKGACVEPRPSASPADLVMAVRAQGLQAKIDVVEEDGTGTPLVASVTRRQGDGVASTMTFYRGPGKCADYRTRQQRELERLK